MNPADYTQDITEHSTSDIEKLAEQLVKLREVQKERQDLLKEADDKIDTLENVLLPEAMRVAGVSACKTSTGLYVELKSKIYASAGGKKEPDRLAEVVSWLLTHGHGSLINHEFILPVGHDQHRSEKLSQLLTDNEIAFIEDTSVNAQSLSAFAREQLENGIELPACMKVYEKKTVTVKLP